MSENTRFVVVFHHENVGDESATQLKSFVGNYGDLSFTTKMDVNGETAFFPRGDQDEALETILSSGVDYMPTKMMISLVDVESFDRGDIPGDNYVPIKEVDDDKPLDGSAPNFIDQFDAIHNVPEDGDVTISVDDGSGQELDTVAFDGVVAGDGEEFDPEIDRILDNDDLFSRMQREDQVIAFLDEVIPSVTEDGGELNVDIDLDELTPNQRRMVETMMAQSNDAVKSAWSRAAGALDYISDYDIDVTKVDLSDHLGGEGFDDVDAYLSDRSKLDELFEQAMREPLRARMIYEEGLQRYLDNQVERLTAIYRRRHPDNSDQIKDAVLEELNPRIREMESQVSRSRLNAVRAVTEELRNQSEAGNHVSELTRYMETRQSEESRLRSLHDGFVEENEQQALIESEQRAQAELEAKKREEEAPEGEGDERVDRVARARHRRRHRAEVTPFSDIVNGVRNRDVSPEVDRVGQSDVAPAVGAGATAVSAADTPAVDEPVAESPVVSGDDSVAVDEPVADKEVAEALTPTEGSESLDGDAEAVSDDAVVDAEDEDEADANEVEEDTESDEENESDDEVEEDEDEAVAPADVVPDTDDLDEAEDFDEDAALDESDPLEVDVDEEGFVDRDTVSGDKLDELDEVGDDKESGGLNKKSIGIIAGVAVAGVLLIGAFVWPGFLMGGGDQEPANEETQSAEEVPGGGDAADESPESDASGMYRVGDRITVLSNNRITDVTVQEFLPEGGALVDSDDGERFMVSQSQLDSFAEDNPDQFENRTGQNTTQN